MLGAAPPRRLGRYELLGEFARGGMASVHLGRLVGPVGFARTVAIKSLHPAYASDPSVVRMFIDEARLTARVSHPNVVPILDVLAEGGNLYLVMDYVQGLSLARLVSDAASRGERLPIPVACAIMVDVLSGLHAAHEALGENGRRLDIVHRDVSPQNVLVGEDGIARVLDFGVAKATSRMHETTDGAVKGKLAYMSPEQAAGSNVDRRSDLFSASIVFWELLTGTPLFKRDSPQATLTALLQNKVDPPSRFAPDLSPAVDALVLHGLARDPDARPASALEMARRLEAIGGLASAHDVGAEVRAMRERLGEADPALSLGLEASMATMAPGAAPLVPAPQPSLRSTAALPIAPTPLSQTMSIAPSLSSGPTTGPHLPAPAPSSRVPAIAALVAFSLAAAVTLGIVGFRMGTGLHRNSPLPDSTSSASAASDPSAASEDSPPDPVAEPAPPLAVPNEPAASVGASAAAATAAPRPRAEGSSRTRARAPSAPKGRPPNPDDCRMVNADGTIGYRAECLR
jgi:serine/threonine-protein kinase